MPRTSTAVKAEILTFRIDPSLKLRIQQVCQAA